jgi:hypothetical protein
MPFFIVALPVIGASGFHPAARLAF